MPHLRNAPHARGLDVASQLAAFHLFSAEERREYVGSSSREELQVLARTLPDYLRRDFDPKSDESGDEAAQEALRVRLLWNGVKFGTPFRRLAFFESLTSVQTEALREFVAPRLLRQPLQPLTSREPNSAPWQLVYEIGDRAPDFEDAPAMTASERALQTLLRLTGLILVVSYAFNLFLVIYERNRP